MPIIVNSPKGKLLRKLIDLEEKIIQTKLKKEKEDGVEPEDYDEFTGNKRKLATLEADLKDLIQSKEKLLEDLDVHLSQENSDISESEFCELEKAIEGIDTYLSIDYDRIKDVWIIKCDQEKMAGVHSDFLAVFLDKYTKPLVQKEFLIGAGIPKELIKNNIRLDSGSQNKGAPTRDLKSELEMIKIVAPSVTALKDAAKEGYNNLKEKDQGKAKKFMSDLSVSDNLASVQTTANRFFRSGFGQTLKDAFQRFLSLLDAFTKDKKEEPPAPSSPSP